MTEKQAPPSPPPVLRHNEEEQGRVVAVRGQVAEVSFPDGARPAMYDVLEVRDVPEAVLEVVTSRSANVFYCLVLRGAERLRRGMKVQNTQEQLTVPVGEAILGRAFDVFAEPHDGGKAFDGAKRRELYRAAERTFATVTSSLQVLETGIKAIDFFTPMLVGGKAAFIGGAGIGKTVILTELVNRMVVQQQQENTLAVFAAVGERSREAEELYRNFKKANVLPATSLILGQMGEVPAVRFRTAYAGAAMAEHFRDVMRRDVLFFMDNIYRFAQAGHELSTLMSQIPSEDGYQPTLASELASLQERLVSTTHGSLTSFMALFVPSDDMTDSAVRSIVPYLDTMVILSREVFQSGRFPAVDLLSSTSAALTPLIIGQEHYGVYIAAKQTLEQADRLERIVSLVGEAELSPDNQLVYRRAQLIYAYVSQDLFVSETETGHAAAFVPLQETIEVIAGILDGKYDQVESDDLRYIGSIANLEERLAQKEQAAKAAKHPAAPVSPPERERAMG